MAGARCGFVPMAEASRAGGNRRIASYGHLWPTHRPTRRFSSLRPLTFLTMLPGAGRGLVTGMVARVHFAGPTRYRLRSAAEIGESILKVSARRMLKGPRQPGWNWLVELNTEILQRLVTTAFKMRDVKEARFYLDSVVISSPALSGVDITPVVQEKFRGSWFAQKNAEARVTVLYCHGGGYSFYPRAYAHFIALITLAAKSRTFALDYRLSPEHRFPAQLEDALNVAIMVYDGRWIDIFDALTKRSQHAQLATA